MFDKRPINSNRLMVEDDDSLYSRSLPHENEFPSRMQRQRGKAKVTWDGIERGGLVKSRMD